MRLCQGQLLVVCRLLSARHCSDFCTNYSCFLYNSLKRIFRSVYQSDLNIRLNVIFHNLVLLKKEKLKKQFAALTVKLFFDILKNLKSTSSVLIVPLLDRKQKTANFFIIKLCKTNDFKKFCNLTDLLYHRTEVSKYNFPPGFRYMYIAANRTRIRM